MSIAGDETGNGLDGAAGDNDDRDSCYSHCTLSLPAADLGSFTPERGTVAPAVPAALISLTSPPADRPPLFRHG